MESLNTIAAESRAVSEGPLKLNVLLVFEDLTTGLRAKEAFDQTMLGLAVDTDVHINAWRFELLREPPLHQQAVNEAAEAEIVFVSAHGAEELPMTVRLWFEQWLAVKREEPRALVVLLDAEAVDTPAAKQLRETLDSATQLSGVDVFQHFGNLQPAPASEDRQHRAGMRSTALGEVRPRVQPPSYRDWGINE
jgi:hypothetical protein